MAMKKRGGGMATRGMGAALKKGGVMKKAAGGGVYSPIGRPTGGVTNTPPKFGGGRPAGEVTNKPPKFGGGISGGPMKRNPPALGKLPIKKIAGFKGGIDSSGRGVYDALKNPQARLKKGGMAKGRKGC